MQPHVPFSPNDRALALRIAASFLWADLEIAESERNFLTNLARELDVEEDVDALLACPPEPERIDPNEIGPHTAGLVRDVALRAIASDGHVHEEEMLMFDLLDDLLCSSTSGASPPTPPPQTRPSR
ncbi:MAG: hypothetical protein KIT84_27605 [Labilithrix sp.]|nr:hypothetical protein [Labilithrix sp.]MCW5814825.1 hypothetical protein [Labilithrix sp.]